MLEKTEGATCSAEEIQTIVCVHWPLGQHLLRSIQQLRRKLTAALDDEKQNESFDPDSGAPLVF